jgi:hypothetical protein
VPQQGVWDIDRFMFKSAYITSNIATDSNLSIRYIGIYPAAITTDRYSYQIKLRDALAVLKRDSVTTYTSNALNFGYDEAGGTYYDFVRDSNYRLGSTSYVLGYSQIRGRFNPDIQSVYTAIPFDINENQLVYTGLAGSLVPYPFFSDASAGTTYFDGNSALYNKGIVLPKTKATPDSNRGPPPGYDQTQSKYELSMPIGTNLLT